MNGRFATLAALGLLLASAASASGCARVTSQRVLASQQSSVRTASGELRQLEPKEADELGAVLTGEIQAVYPSDTGLARVYGQVANLGKEAYAEVRFNIVARQDHGGSEGESTKVVASFTVGGGFAPGDIESFDVQTSARMGDVENLAVTVDALR